MLSLYHYFLISFSVEILGMFRYYESWDIRILIVISLCHSFLVSFFPILRMTIPSIYILYMNEWKDEWKNYHLSIWTKKEKFTPLFLEFFIWRESNLSASHFASCLGTSLSESDFLRHESKVIGYHILVLGLPEWVYIKICPSKILFVTLVLLFLTSLKSNGKMSHH